jgi:hypothetical protein
MTISYDKVIPSKKPETWKLPVIYGISVVIGVIITVGKKKIPRIFLIK